MVIETSGLTKVYGDAAVVDGVDLAVPQGSVYGFLGPNGAGKSTTIRMLLGLVRPTRGTVRLFGEELTPQRRSVLRLVGGLAETPSLYPHLTARDNLRVTALLREVPPRRIDEVLEVVGLAHAARQRVGTFSLGMKQRLGLALALLSEPLLLVLDEPTNGLDPAGIREMRALVSALPRRFGTTVFLSSHLLHEVERVATHVGVLHRGRLLFQGPTSELKRGGADIEDVFLHLTEAA